MRNQTDKANKKKHDTVGAKSGKQKTFTTAAEKTVDTMQVGKLIKTMDIDPPAVHFSFRAAKKKTVPRVLSFDVGRAPAHICADY